MENTNKFKFVKGIPLIPEIHDVEEIERMCDDFEVRDNDVIIMTYPKSGTHWMIDILSLIYSKGDPTWVKSVPYWKRSPWIEVKGSIGIIKNQVDPRLLTSHLPIQLFPKSYFTSKAKMICVARNPRDIIVSLYHFCSQGPFHALYSNFEQVFDGFLQGNVFFGSWFDHIKGWLSRRDSENFLFVTYEELHQDFMASVKKICQFLGKELSEEEINLVVENASFQVMKQRMLEDKEFIPMKNTEYLKMITLRKGICGDWKNYFTVTQMETFNQLYQEKMNRLDQDLFPWDQC
ncbi:bile salt sulfotransferase-like [Trichosurus vulpecula]|uniref:bile salt sulfotransferase-like n=1 Tax=Trichosurus vulpecula TaxID=9337 RepID=UPI00186B4EB0|nr:bile salt sulfotransferase-like [Trichosurus vulpecula]